MDSNDTTQTSTSKPLSPDEEMILNGDGGFIRRYIITSEEITLLTKEEVISAKNIVTESLDFLYSHGFKTSSIINFTVLPEEKEPMVFDLKEKLGQEKAASAEKLIERFVAEYHRWV